jgi:hypothetical protein
VINNERKGEFMDEVVLSSGAVERELDDSLSIVELEERFEMAEADLDRCRCIIL